MEAITVSAPVMLEGKLRQEAASKTREVRTKFRLTQGERFGDQEIVAAGNEAVH
jgi:hypothetical protein